MVLFAGHGHASENDGGSSPRMWIVTARACPKEVGSDLWSSVRIYQLDESRHLMERRLKDLWRHVHGRPVLIQIQGIEVTLELAVDGMIKTRSWLENQHALPPDAVLITFDWPSHAGYFSPIKNVNEECRRAIVAGSHLAQLVQAFPPDSRVCLFGHSHGGRAIAACLHLFGGGSLGRSDSTPEFRLDRTRSDLRIRAVAIAAGIDHHWLAPGEKLGNALQGCEVFFNLYNRKDPLLFFYPLMANGDHSSALGRIGMSWRNKERLGPLMPRYVERDIGPHVGVSHRLDGVLACPSLAGWLRPYTWSNEPTDRRGCIDEASGAR